jgi:hypothetical protein
MNVKIVNVAVNGYGVYQGELLRSLSRVGYPGQRMCWLEGYPAGCPTHQESHYHFKTFAMLEAAAANPDILIWLDAPLQAIRSLDPLIEAIDRDGYYLCKSGNMVGDWSSDFCLTTMGLSREEAWKIPEINAGVIGLKLPGGWSASFLNQWHRYAEAGCFHADWMNDLCQVSADNRVQGHRHDQTVASILAHRLGMTTLHDVGPNDFYAYAFLDGHQPGPSTILVNTGHSQKSS